MQVIRSTCPGGSVGYVGLHGNDEIPVSKPPRTVISAFTRVRHSDGFCHRELISYSAKPFIESSKASHGRA